MEWNAIMELLDPKLIIVLAMSWVVGFTLKQTPYVPDWCIIFIVSIVTIVISIWLLGWSPESLIQGVLTGAVAVYGNQLVKQIKKGVEHE